MNRPEDSTIINVCIIPDKQVGAECVNISQALKNEDTLFALGDNLFAHMTVYMARFADSEVARVVAGVEKALQSASPFRCEMTGYFMTAGRYLEVSYRKSANFMELHEALIGHLAGLRINPGNPYEEGYFTPYTTEQQKNAQETGYDLARNLYRPHITLTRYKEGAMPEVFPAFPATNLNFELHNICIYKADDNGAVYELVREFNI